MSSASSTFLGLPSGQLKSFLLHAARHSPYYREQDWAKNLLAGLPVRLQDIPVTPKSAVQSHPASFRSEFDPVEAGPVHVKHTSGSTGTPLTIAKSALHFQINQRENQRLLAPWQIDKYEAGVDLQVPDETHPTGTVVVRQTAQGHRRISVHSLTASDLSTALRQFRASLLSCQPSQALAVLEDGNDYSFLRLVKTLTEAVPDALRNRISALSDCRLVDMYGAVETALIAASCPQCGNYHLARANSHIEILNDQDLPAEEGEIGRVVATVFSNAATPLIRYDLGDVVRFTTRATCEPGQISITKIYGRERMIFHLPNGERVLAAFPPEIATELGIRRFKMVQTALDEVEFRYQAFSPVQAIDLDKLRQEFSAQMSPLFKLNPVAVTEFPLAPSGKYIMHERLIP